MLQLLQKNSARAVLWGRTGYSLLFRCCQLVRYLGGEMQVALPGWWVRSLSSANKNAVSAQAETFRVYVFVTG